MKRRLTTILYADVAGYSRLTQLDEEQTHQKLDAGLNLLTSMIQKHDGRKIHEAGDAILAEFHSVITAVNCAIGFQLAVATQFKLTEEERLEFRIGVNLGEVIEDRDDIYGDGVNASARIQELAEPGGVCVSSTVFEQVNEKIDHTFDDLGYRQVKNIAKPIHVYRVRLPGSGTPQSETQRPFFDMSGKRKPLFTGGCWCGEIRYEIGAPTIDTNFCHCRMCQRFSGAPIVAGSTFPAEAFRLTQGEPKYYKTSLIAERGFCANCGSSLFYRGLVSKWSDWILIFTASLDNPEKFAPTWHLGVESQMPWLDVHDDLPRIRSEDSPDLVEAWESAGVHSSDPPRNTNIRNNA